MRQRRLLLYSDFFFVFALESVKYLLLFTVGFELNLKFADPSTFEVFIFLIAGLSCILVSFISDSYCGKYYTAIVGIALAIAGTFVFSVGIYLRDERGIEYWCKLIATWLLLAYIVTSNSRNNLILDQILLPKRVKRTRLYVFTLIYFKVVARLLFVIFYINLGYLDTDSMMILIITVNLALIIMIVYLIVLLLSGKEIYFEAVYLRMWEYCIKSFVLGYKYRELYNERSSISPEHTRTVKFLLQKRQLTHGSFGKHSTHSDTSLHGSAHAKPRHKKNVKYKDSTPKDTIVFQSGKYVHKTVPTDARSVKNQHDIISHPETGTKHIHFWGYRAIKTVPEDQAQKAETKEEAKNPEVEAPGKPNETRMSVKPIETVTQEKKPLEKPSSWWHSVATFHWLGKKEEEEPEEEVEETHTYEMRHWLYSAHLMYPEYVIFQTMRALGISIFLILGFSFPILMYLILVKTFMLADISKRTNVNFGLAYFELQTYSIAFELLCFPLLEYVIIPSLRRFFRKDLSFALIGFGILIFTGIVMIAIESYNYANLQFIPSRETGQLRVYNALVTKTFASTVDNPNIRIGPYNYYLIKDISLNGPMGDLFFNVKNVESGVSSSLKIKLYEKRTVSCIVSSNGLVQTETMDPTIFMEQSPRSDATSHFYVVSQLGNIDSMISFINRQTKQIIKVKLNDPGKLKVIPEGLYKMRYKTANGTSSFSILANVKPNALYSLFIYPTETSIEGELILVEGPLPVNYETYILIIFLVYLAQAFATVSYFRFIYLESPVKLRDTILNTILSVNLLAIAFFSSRFFLVKCLVLELMKEVGDDEDSSDISGYHSDSDSAIMMSGNSPYVTKRARHNFLTRSVRSSSNRSGRTCLGLSSSSTDSPPDRESTTDWEWSGSKSNNSCRSVVSTERDLKTKSLVKPWCSSCEDRAVLQVTTITVPDMTNHQSEVTALQSELERTRMELEQTKARLQVLDTQAQAKELSGPRLVRCYGNLYSQGRVEALNALDTLPPLKDASELKSKILFSVIVLAFRATSGQLSTKREQMRRILLSPAPQTNAHKELEEAVATYLRRTVDTFDLTHCIEEVSSQLWATLYDYPCLKNCPGLTQYIKDSVRLAWALVNQGAGYCLEYEERVFRREMHVRFHSADTESNSIRTYLWPALLESPSGPCVYKAVVLT